MAKASTRIPKTTLVVVGVTCSRSNHGCLCRVEKHKVVTGVNSILMFSSQIFQKHINFKTWNGKMS